MGEVLEGQWSHFIEKSLIQEYYTGGHTRFETKKLFSFQCIQSNTVPGEAAFSSKVLGKLCKMNLIDKPETAASRSEVIAGS